MPKRLDIGYKYLGDVFRSVAWTTIPTTTGDEGQNQSKHCQEDLFSGIVKI
jgi:hypothetical protein